jgi:hypothetical protein
MDYKFKVGDKVKIIEECSGTKSGVIYPLRMHKGKLYVFPEYPNTKRGCCCQSFWKLFKEANPMSKYDGLKNKIEGLNNGWTKEADDVLDELGESVKSFWEKNHVEEYAPIILTIPLTKIGGMSVENAENKEFFHIDYNSQCEKNQAFKKALLWLLDHSDIKKDIVGTEQKVEIEGKVYKAKIIEETNA